MTLRPTLEAIFTHMDRDAEDGGCWRCRTYGQPLCPEGRRLDAEDRAAHAALTREGAR